MHIFNLSFNLIFWICKCCFYFVFRYEDAARGQTQPDGLENEQCFIIDLFSIHNMNDWHDVPCTCYTLNSFICEKSYATSDEGKYWCQVTTKNVSEITVFIWILRFHKQILKLNVPLYAFYLPSLIYALNINPRLIKYILTFSYIYIQCNIYYFVRHVSLYNVYNVTVTIYLNVYFYRNSSCFIIRVYINKRNSLLNAYLIHVRFSLR